MAHTGRGARATLAAMAEGPSPEQIRLALPAEPEYGRLARITASRLALNMGFTFPEIEDLRLAVDEMIILLLRPEGRSGEIIITFTVEPTGLTLDATSTAGTDQPWLDQGALGRFEAIVRDTVDQFAVDEHGHQVHLVKLRH
jgi:anti-sigma regulatory factor (Ser/Thr protein kinase)